MEGGTKDVGMAEGTLGAFTYTVGSTEGAIVEGREE